MSSGYSKSIEFLYELQWHGIKLGLDNIQRLLRNLGSPQSNYASIHLAGTNGKGSTAAILGSILRKAGVSTGLYTSPHLRDFTERIQVNGIPISEEAVAGLVSRIRDKAGELPLTFFEFTTAMAFLFFADRGIRIGLFETGMGGRFDATNILSPAVSIITNVELDHQKYLGGTVREIAIQKAGIIKAGIPVVTAADRTDALDVIQRTVDEQRVPLYRFGWDFDAVGEEGETFRYEGISRTITGLRCGLPGKHQVKNAACAIAAIELIAPSLPDEEAFSDDVLRRGLSEVRWPGRFEVLPVKAGQPEVILDGAHNPAAARALREHLENSSPDLAGRTILVLGVLADKDLDGILDALIPVAREVVATRPDYNRALAAEDLRRAVSRYNIPVTVCDTVPAAMHFAMKAAHPGDRVLVAGSLFTVGEARSFLLGFSGPSPVKG